MLNLPALRWGKPYESMELAEVSHFLTGEPVARVSQTNGGLVQRDMRLAPKARDALRSIPIDDLLDRVSRAGELFLNATLAVGDGQQTPTDFVRAQSATTGLPEHMCAANMQKNHFVLSHLREILDALTRGLDLNILARGYGRESRGVVVSYQAQSPVLGLVLPNNSPGVHALWLPVLAMQVGLVIKPGSQELWTPYRMAAAMFEAGIPREAIGLYPGATDVGAAVLASCGRSMIFGGAATVAQYSGNPRVQVHGPGFSKIILGDDCVDDWEQHLDLMVESIYRNGGRSCINASSVWASRHTSEIAAALAKRLGPIDVLPPDDPECGLAAFTTPGVPQAVWKSIEAKLREPGATHVTADYGPRLVEKERCAYLRPTIVHCTSPAHALAKDEYMYPFATVIECPQDKMLDAIGPTLVGTAITRDTAFRQALTDSVHIDRLNIGPIPTTQLDWLQPHEGNIVEFLFRARALQMKD